MDGTTKQMNMVCMLVVVAVLIINLLAMMSFMWKKNSRLWS